MGKPGGFVKGDPRCNRKGRPKKQDVFKILRATLEMPIGELPEGDKEYVKNHLKTYGLNITDKMTLGHCFVRRYFGIVLDPDKKDETALRAISEFFNRTMPNKLDIEVGEKDAVESKFANLSVEKLEQIQKILNNNEDE